MAEQYEPTEVRAIARDVLDGTISDQTGVLFKGDHTDPQDLKQLVGMGVGLASMCWLERPHGEFDSQMASGVVTEMLDWINEHYVLREHPTAASSRPWASSPSSRE